jgi:dTDP-4-amino-4,6-dideoxygalactose transaminase
VGTNSKLSEQDASHLLVRAQHISAWQRRREVTRLYYLDQFKNIPIKCLSAGFRTHADQKFVVYTEQRDHLKQYLTSKGVETKIHYERALSELPIAMPYIKPTMLATSVFLTRGVLSLPIYPELTDGEIEYIVQSVLEFFAK